MSLWKTLKWIKKNMVVSIPVAILAGVGAGYFADLSFLKKGVTTITVLMVYPMLVTVDIKSLFSRCSYRLQITAQLINFVFFPLMGYGLGLLFLKGNPEMAYGLLLVSLLPTGSMTVSWTGFGGGNVSVAVKMVIFGLFAGALIAPVYSQFLMGQAIEIPMAAMFSKICVIIFLPLILGALTRGILIRAAGKERFDSHWKEKFPLFSTFMVLCMIFTAMASVEPSSTTITSKGRYV